MNKYQIKIELISPVCIARKRGARNVIETLDYIPGSTVRGVLASLYLQKNGTYDQGKWGLGTPLKDEFHNMFNSENTRFGDSYYKGQRVIPQTAASCKYYPGFSSKYHGVFDMMIPAAEYELLGKNDTEFQMEEKFEKCQGDVEGVKCNSAMERFSGYYEQVNTATFQRETPSKRLIAHTEVMNSLETAFPGRLYTIEVLNEGQKFSGCLETDENTFKKLKDILGNNTLRIGTAKSRALGLIKLDFKIPAESRWTIKEVHKRILGMRKGIENYIDKKNSTDQNNKKDKIEGFKKRCFFSITLQSDIILRDEILRFKSSLGIQDLINALTDSNGSKDLLQKFQLLRAWSSINIISGWNIAIKLPKEDEIAISKGSVFLFVTKPNEILTDDDINLLAASLSKIEDSGIGERKNEGFGKIRICDEFHWRVPHK